MTATHTTGAPLAGGSTPPPSAPRRRRPWRPADGTARREAVAAAAGPPRPSPAQLHRHVGLRRPRGAGVRARRRAATSSMPTGAATSTGCPGCSAPTSATPSAPRWARPRAAALRARVHPDVDRRAPGRDRARRADRLPRPRPAWSTCSSPTPAARPSSRRGSSRGSGTPSTDSPSGARRSPAACAYHGTTLGRAQLHRVRRRPRALRAARGPDAPRLATCAYRHPLGEDEAAFCAALLAEIEDAIEFEGADTVAMLIAEPMQNSGGSFMPPAGYWAGLREICDRHGILLVADEVITGFGRAGPLVRLGALRRRPRHDHLRQGRHRGPRPARGRARARAGRRAVRDRAARAFAHGLTWGGHPLSSGHRAHRARHRRTRGVLDNVRANEPLTCRRGCEELRGAPHRGRRPRGRPPLGARAGQGPRDQAAVHAEECDWLLRGVLSDHMADAWAAVPARRPRRAGHPALPTARRRHRAARPHGRHRGDRARRRARPRAAGGPPQPNGAAAAAGPRADLLRRDGGRADRRGRGATARERRDSRRMARCEPRWTRAATSSCSTRRVAAACPAHAARVDAWTSARLDRASRGRRHPVDDFLFTYYPTRPAQLRRWHPGLGRRAARRDAVGGRTRRTATREIAAVPSSPRTSTRAVRPTPRRARLGRGPGTPDALSDPADSAASGCTSGRWSTGSSRTRCGTSRGRCGSPRRGPRRRRRAAACAARTSTPTASSRPRRCRSTRCGPTRATQPDLEQPGCLHATMDLYKWACEVRRAGRQRPRRRLLRARTRRAPARHGGGAVRPARARATTPSRSRRRTAGRSTSAGSARARRAAPHRCAHGSPLALRRRLSLADVDAAAVVVGSTS